MKIVNVKIKDLKFAEYNPRKMNEKQAADLEESIRRFGFAEPIVVNRHKGRENVIVGGHMRVRVAKKMGIKDVPVVYVTLPLEKEKELNLRLNRNLGEWDWDLLADFNQDILLDVGFGGDELEAHFGIDVEEDEFDADAEYWKIKEPKAKEGDLYQLGRHRLLCGDSTKKESFEKLMAGTLADMVFTDPPYNVNYNYNKYEAIHKGRKVKFEDGGKIFNDKKSPEEFYKFLLDVFKNVYDFSRDAMTLYVCHATKTQSEFFRALADNKFLFSQTIIWLKERIILALGQDYHRIYEPIWYGWKKGKKRAVNKKIVYEKEVWDLDRLSFEERLDLWYLKRDKSADYIHPTQKPTRLAERAIRKGCPPKGLVLEPFNGSGSTMMACEQMGRKCYAIELDPKYIDVAIARWENFTGKKAIKL